ncbi:MULTISPECIES: hypothetical protein [unclassified Arthrobacter]|uniref:hypothetical protein n=1 Tax=unclassified Arthrobacter TaxID=235627 RepID=UPI001E5DD7B3|nr:MULTISPECIES: hypothetical protein [unclassified Arthrobacter]MCC9145261.1 hypothetical protein [Arthrobacter sp. zg-Y919]MDK1276489.1 hypothetical protein [Arthrobacter sp. zg.Y919]MDM7989132.1 hypothetical protein [Arthrobacter sp. zg-Y877]WIB01915.1 hypothetical protein QNO10_07900 [Arthrobacter sp. zg-Y919]
MTSVYGLVRETRNPAAAMKASTDPAATYPDRQHGQDNRQKPPSATGAVIAWDPDDLPGALDRLISAHPGHFSHPEALPVRPVPFRMHLLDADVPKPIQLHPRPDQALAGFVREQTRGVPLNAGNRNYKDRYAKFEVAVALTPLRVLSGERSREELRVIADGADLPWLHALLTFRHETPVHALLRMESSEIARALRETEAAMAGVADAVGPVADVAAVFRRLAPLFPGDRGILIAICMNLIKLDPGQAMVTPAGCLHSYLSGQAMVVMGLSDNALKAGLTKDYVDIAELQQVLGDGQTGPAPLPVERMDEFQENIPLWSEDLGLRRAVVDGTAAAIPLERFTVVLTALGDARVTVGDVSTDLEQGASMLYLGDPTTATVDGHAQIFIASRS